MPISTLGYFDLVFATNGQSQYKTLQDFIAAARKEPGKLNVGTIGVGGTQNLAAELFKSSANLQFQIIPHRTTPEVIVSLLRNDVSLMIDFYAAMKGALSDNKIHAVATSGPERTPYLKDVPTVAEAGVAGYDVTSWNGIFAPHGTPQTVIDTLNKAMHEVLAIPDVEREILRSRRRGQGEHARCADVAPEGRYHKMGRRDREGRHSEAVKRSLALFVLCEPAACRGLFVCVRVVARYRSNQIDEQAPVQQLSRAKSARRPHCAPAIQCFRT